MFEGQATLQIYKMFACYGTTSSFRVCVSSSGIIAQQHNEHQLLVMCGTRSEGSIVVAGLNQPWRPEILARTPGGRVKYEEVHGVGSLGK